MYEGNHLYYEVDGNGVLHRFISMESPIALASKTRILHVFTHDGIAEARFVDTGNQVKSTDVVYKTIGQSRFGDAILVTDGERLPFDANYVLEHGTLWEQQKPLTHEECRMINKYNVCHDPSMPDKGTEQAIHAILDAKYKLVPQMSPSDPRISKEYASGLFPDSMAQSETENTLREGMYDRDMKGGRALPREYGYVLAKKDSMVHVSAGRGLSADRRSGRFPGPMPSSN